MRLSGKAESRVAFGVIFTVTANGTPHAEPCANTESDSQLGVATINHILKTWINLPLFSTENTLYQRHVGRVRALPPQPDEKI